MTQVAQLTLPDAHRWQPNWPAADDLDAIRVLCVLARNEGQVVQRKALARESGLSDRAVRAAIERLVTAWEWPITSTSGRGGYALVFDREQIEASLRESEARMRALGRRRRAYRRILERVA